MQEARLRTYSYQPLFNDNETFDRLLSLYNIGKYVDLLNNNTFVNDSRYSYVIVTTNVYILVLNYNSTWKMIIRDNYRVYMDSITKSGWVIDVKATQKKVEFYIRNDIKTSLLFEITNEKIKFNKTFFNFNGLESVTRIIASILC